MAKDGKTHTRILNGASTVTIAVIAIVNKKRHPMCGPPGHKKRAAKGNNRSNKRKFEKLLNEGRIPTDRPRHM